MATKDESAHRESPMDCSNLDAKIMWWLKIK